MHNTTTRNIQFSVTEPVDELVLVIDRAELTKQGVGTDGIYPFSLNDVNPKAFGYLLRSHADNKSPTSIEIGKLLPQILGYFQLISRDGRILTYRRKGKEKGLLGKRSIGVGGHVDLLDGLYLRSVTNHQPCIGLSTHITPTIRTEIGEIICIGAERELLEEVGLPTVLAVPNNHTDNGHLNGMNFGYGYDRILSSFADPTSSVHVGLPREILVTNCAQLVYDENEYNDVEWLTKAELKELKAELIAENSESGFETWSALLIDSF